MVDLVCSLGLLSLAVALAAAYIVRLCWRGPARFERVDRLGGSVLLGRGLMEMAYWALTPLARGCARLGLTAAAVTCASMGLAAGAGCALAAGHFGVAAVLVAASGLGDALDGLVARATATASRAGAVLDSSADRYGEFFFLAGLAMHYRASAALLGLVLLALLGSFMISYSTARAEALGVAPPRGAMRRHERAFYLSLGAWLTPLLGALTAHGRRAELPAHAAMVVALGLVAVVANVSAVRRLWSVATADRSQAPARSSVTPTRPRGASTGAVGSGASW